MKKVYLFLFLFVNTLSCKYVKVNYGNIELVRGEEGCFRSNGYNYCRNCVKREVKCRRGWEKPVNECIGREIKYANRYIVFYGGVKGYVLNLFEVLGEDNFSQVFVLNRYVRKLCTHGGPLTLGQTISGYHNGLMTGSLIRRDDIILQLRDVAKNLFWIDIEKGKQMDTDNGEKIVMEFKELEG